MYLYSKMVNKKDCEKIFKALSNSARLEIIRLLSEHQFCVNALVSRMNISQAAVSQHLKILENAGLVKKRKEGYWIHYALVPEGFQNGYIFLNKIQELKEGGGQCVKEQKTGVKKGKTQKPVRPSR
jgi:ArsR family transcriptional regulator, arsenate/arsenite/antimonite-responsive transcriptional repressor